MSPLFGTTTGVVDDNTPAFLAALEKWKAENGIVGPNVIPGFQPENIKPIDSGVYANWLKSDYNFDKSTNPNALAPPPISPPGEAPVVAPPATFSPSQPTTSLPQPNQQAGANQIPMPGQLSALAQQSPLFDYSKTGLLGDNWASMFNQ